MAQLIVFILSIGMMFLGLYLGGVFVPVGIVLGVMGFLITFSV